MEEVELDRCNGTAHEHEEIKKLYASCYMEGLFPIHDSGDPLTWDEAIT